MINYRILVDAVTYACRSQFYKNKYNGVVPTVNDIKDFVKIPFTTKKEIRDAELYSTLALPFENVRRIHSSSGTKDFPTYTYYTQQDLYNWSNHLHQAFRSAGLSKGDIFQTIVSFGLFSGGLGFQMAAETYGMTVIPSGTGNTEKQIELLKKFKVNAFIAISSYIPVLIHYMQSMEFNPKIELNLKAIFIGAEPFNPKEKKIWEEFFGVPILGIYGMSEIEGPGIGYECQAGNGMHICEEDFYVEIINPIDGTPIENGNEGEIVITTLKREAMPLIRFRTGDISKIYNKICPCCGKNILKLDYVRHRSDDMLIIRGVNIYPHEIENIIFNIPEIHNSFKIIISKNDTVTLLLSYQENEKERDAVEKYIISECKKRLYITINIEWVNIEYILNTIGKRTLVIDQRIWKKNHINMCVMYAIYIPL